MFVEAGGDEIILCESVVSYRKLDFHKRSYAVSYNILVLNLGGTSTKVSIYKDDQHVATKSILHSPEEMDANPLSKDQVEYRKKLVVEFMSENGYSVDDLDAIAMRWPPLNVKKGGTYLVEGKCRDIIMANYFPDERPIHGSRVVLPMVDSMLGDRKIPLYLVDPDITDEFSEIAHVSGLPDYPRKPSIHYLNHKAVARKYAADIGKKYNDLRLIICHLGGGIDIGAHEYGIAVDANEGFSGDGPFSSDRAGTVSSGVMLNICFDKGLSRKEAFKMVRGSGAGIKGHLGTDDLREVEKRIADGDKKAKLIFDALAYQIAKEIGRCYAVLRGKVDAILFTGGIAYSHAMISAITEYVGDFAPIAVYPGEMEQEALALGAYRVLVGAEEPIIM